MTNTINFSEISRKIFSKTFLFFFLISVSIVLVIFYYPKNNEENKKTKQEQNYSSNKLEIKISKDREMYQLGKHFQQTRQTNGLFVKSRI